MADAPESRLERMSRVSVYKEIYIALSAALKYHPRLRPLSEGKATRWLTLADAGVAARVVWLNRRQVPVNVPQIVANKPPGLLCSTRRTFLPTLIGS
jgi:hypothetical protein